LNLFLKDKIAFVAGSSRGLGYAAAHLLAEEGAKVAINGRNQEKLQSTQAHIQKETHPDILAVPGDVTDPRFADNAISRVVNQWGGIDILITNAGGPVSGAFEQFDDLDWTSAIELSLLSHVRLIRSALPYLRKSSAPSVLTITSIAVKQPIPNLILSNSIRAATAGLTKSLALELGKDGIRFNSILPGLTQTERVDQVLQARADIHGTTLEIEKEKQASESSLGRLCSTIEFARVAVFIVSPAASYITGAMINVDGGSYKGLF